MAGFAKGKKYVSNVLKKAITLVSEVLELDLNEINPETSLMGEPAWDSLAHMRIILAIEGFIGHELLPERLVEIMSVTDIARVIELEEASLSPVITPPVRPAIKKRPAKIRITNQTIPAHRSIQPKMRTIGRINQIDAKAWDACGGNENPFLSYGFLSSLEESKSVSPEKGFRICHLILEGPKGELLGGSPCYLCF